MSCKKGQNTLFTSKDVLLWTSSGFDSEVTNANCCASFVTLVSKIEVLAILVGFSKQDNYKEKS
jgi:hypothetical protein